MNDSDPIVPGKSAAGVRIGEPIRDVLATSSPAATDQFHGIEKFTFEAVTIWAKNGHVEQIGVRHPYRGTVGLSIGIGSTIANVEEVFGPVTEDDEDNLVVVDHPGWCFETEEWVDGHSPERNKNARISEIYVFAPRA